MPIFCVIDSIFQLIADPNWPNLVGFGVDIFIGTDVVTDLLAANEMLQTYKERDKSETKLLVMAIFGFITASLGILVDVFILIMKRDARKKHKRNLRRLDNQLAHG